MAISASRLGLAVSAAAVLVTLQPWQPTASASQSRPSSEPDALQVFADVVLIEAECRTLNADYGKLFAYAERNGLKPVDLMPMGDRRAAFDAAYQRRAREMRVDRLCSDLAAEREASVPGVFTAR